MNDYIVPQDEKGFGKRHFVIKFCPEKKCYLLKDLEDGTGTFIKISPKVALKNNSIISFGDIHFAVIFPPKDQENKNTMIIKFLEGPRAKETMYFIQ